MSRLGADIDAALAGIWDPCSAATGAPLSVLEMGLVTGWTSNAGGEVVVHLRLTSAECLLFPRMVSAIERLLGRVAGVESVEVRMDHESVWTPESMDVGARGLLEERRQRFLRMNRVRPRQWRESGGAGGQISPPRDRSEDR